jgi:glyoxylase-like metal-dependent hydrolase (beta-lactamase superfamily II)
VVLHQPERRLLISGDHLLGRVSLFFDHGHTPDPVGEFAASLDRVEQLDVGLCLAGHGRPFRDVAIKVAGNREQLAEQRDKVAAAIASESRTAFEVAVELIGPENMSPATAAWGLQLALAYLDHLVAAGAAAVESDTEGVRRWLRTPN